MSCDNGMLFSPSSYPLSDAFICRMNAGLVARLEAAGWEIPGTLFFEIPFCAISGVGAGIARDYSNKVYYKIFCSTTSVLDSLNDNELSVVIDHEMDEIRSAVGDASIVSARAPLVTFKIEKRRHDNELAELAKHHGEGTVRNSLQKVQDAAAQYPIIPRTILLFWLTSYLSNRFVEFESLSYDMSTEMMSKAQVDDHLHYLAEVKRSYGSNVVEDAYMKLFINAIKVRGNVSDA